MDAIGFSKHDHQTCVKSGIQAALNYCEKNNVQLTPTRQRVLEILLSEHRAMGAYEVLEFLSAEGIGNKPPVAYRALDFLVTHGFVHKIERINAFVACAHPGQSHTPAFLICRKCSYVAEAHLGLDDTQLAQIVSQTGFSLDRTVIEALGCCPDCHGTKKID